MKCGAFDSVLRAAIGVVAAFVVLWPLDAARAACDPAANNNVTATCTGATVDQDGGAPGTSGGANGYGTGGENNLNVTVVPGASVTANGGHGIFFNTGSVVNDGTITANGGSGIFAGTFATVVNSGTITSFAGNGISARSLNLVNSGTISGVGAGNSGIGAQDLRIVNSGTISGDANGIGAFGGAMNITNSGTISGGAAAIATTVSVPDTLTLLPGSKIIGTIDLGGGGDTINVRTGNQNLTFAAGNLAGATVSSTVPFVVSGNQVVTIDPTPFAANGRALGDFSRNVSQVVPSFGNLPASTGDAPTAFAAPEQPSSIFTPAFDSIPGLSAYAADQAVFKAPTVVHADGTAVWARGFGGTRVQQADGVLLHTTNSFYGGAIGIEKQVRSDLRFGAFAGGGATRSSIELNTGDTNSNLGFGGIYARTFRGAWFLYAAFQGGGSRNDTTRNNINNNLVAGGTETAKGSYSGWYVSPELKLGHNVALGQAFGAQHTLTPSIGVRYFYGAFGSYTETGSTANLTVNSQTVQTLEERAELKLTRATLLSRDVALLIDLTGGALGVQRIGSNTVNAALLGQSIPFAAPGKDDVYGGFGGLGMEFRTANIAVFASGEYLWLSDSSTVISGKGGVRVAF